MSVPARCTHAIHTEGPGFTLFYLQGSWCIEEGDIHTDRSASEMEPQHSRGSTHAEDIRGLESTRASPRVWEWPVEKWAIVRGHNPKGCQKRETQMNFDPKPGYGPALNSQLGLPCSIHGNHIRKCKQGWQLQDQRAGLPSHKQIDSCESQDS